MYSGSCWCDQSQARGEIHRLSVQSGHQGYIPPTPSPWKQNNVTSFSARSWVHNVTTLFCFFKFSFHPQNLLQICYLPSQCVKRRSVLWRVRKVQVSSGNSTLDGWGMGSHNRIITLAADGELGLPPNGHMWPVQWRTWKTRSEICVGLLYGWILLQDMDIIQNNPFWWNGVICCVVHNGIKV